MSTLVHDTVVPPSLMAAYTNRTAAGEAHYAAGGHVCGYFGNGMPVEVALATGHMPMAIMPLPDRPTPHADEWLHDTFNPQLRLVFDHLISGELGFVDLAIQVSQASPDSAVFVAARELLRQGFGGHIPPLHHYSLLGLRHPAVREYGRMEIDGLARRLRANSGQEATPAELRKAIDLVNAVRAQWRRLDGLRREGVVSGSDALTLMAPSRFMGLADYLGEITRAVDALGGTQLSGPRVLVISSTALSDNRLHSAIEAGGAVVVSEDDIWGARSATADIVAGDDPLQAIYDHYYETVPNLSVYPASVRLGWWYANSTGPGIDAVIIHMPRSDRNLGWDYPRMRDYLADHDQPHLMTRQDPTTAAGAAALTAEVAAFVAKLQE